MERLGLRAPINRLVPTEREFEPGLMVLAMVVDTLSGRGPLHIGEHGDYGGLRSSAAIAAPSNKALDPTARAVCPQASLLPYSVLAGQRRDSCAQSIWTYHMGRVF
jgi:hypothetical protein